MSQSKIYVGNLPFNTNQDDLRDFFIQYGEISDVRLITDRETGRSRGFGFVTFETDEFAQAALQADQQELSGRKLKVSIAKERQA